jgi:hypothetical protein
MTKLPTREQMFDNAVELLNQAYKLLGDAADWLRSDWRPMGSPLTDVQAARRRAMFAAIETSAMTPGHPGQS